MASVEELTQQVQQVERELFDRSTLTPGEEVGQVCDIFLPGPASQLRARIYNPKDSGAGKQASPPVLVYFHGGGFVVGGIDLPTDGITRALANAVPCIVVSVDYRLAPRARFPAAVDDCYAATAWVASHLEELGAAGGKVAVGGDSAGGNLAASVAILARDRGGPSLVHQVLFYPVIEAPEATGDQPRPSVLEKHSGVDWEKVRSLVFQAYFASPEDARDMRFKVNDADLRGLPPASVLTCQHDPLRDEGQAFAEQLKESGVSVSFQHFDEAHGFLDHEGPPRHRAIQAVAADLRKSFQSTSRLTGC